MLWLLNFYLGLFFLLHIIQHPHPFSWINCSFWINCRFLILCGNHEYHSPQVSVMPTTFYLFPVLGLLILPVYFSQWIVVETSGISLQIYLKSQQYRFSHFFVIKSNMYKTQTYRKFLQLSFFKKIAYYFAYVCHPNFIPFSDWMKSCFLAYTISNAMQCNKIKYKTKNWAIMKKNNTVQHLWLPVLPTHFLPTARFDLAVYIHDNRFISRDINISEQSSSHFDLFRQAYHIKLLH